MGQALSNLGSILSEMGQALSNLGSILFGRKKKAKITDEENGYREVKLTHPSSGYGNTRVSKKDEGPVVIVINNAEFREDVESFRSASCDPKTRVSEDERVSIIIESGANQIVEKIKPTLHVSSGEKTRDSEDERVSVIIDNGADQIVEKIKPTLDVSTGGKAKVSEDKRVSIIIDSGADQTVERIKSTLHVSTREKITVSKADLGEKAPNRRILKDERRIKHYYRSHKILLVGEGDFSFSACLAKIFGSADNMVSTSLDPIGFLKKNYSKAMSNINDLKSRGCMVLHGVDATTMSGHVFLKGMKFDRIIYNFPYAGWFKQESRESQMSRHQKLVTLFFKNAKKMLSEKGEIHISHKSEGFHQEWDIVYLASLCGLNLMKAERFNLKDYPGYNTKFGFGGDGNFNCNPSQTYMFGL
ncbi:hypothetical protein NE237_028962 [Protea cynaroides]|uniref:25S rRNA (uridine-N(3))-methyltransferase BMT5-like domain-containing protein n=1 Tax=Protea cynaroides TaxID=273540 RepID=A0A9Q0JVN2_9MAGN|nr:hypothetical protein NE237_028962 [Protea cynaroides]